MNTFLNKVQAEREILRVVNSVTKGKRQLAGLSSGAIEQWKHQNAVAPDDALVPMLFELASHCQTLSDRSNENFSELSASNSSFLLSRIADLRSAVSVLR
jgi:hypothetical protein